jgi:hypothetical protein
MNSRRLGAGEQCVRHFEAERPCSLEVDHRFVFGGRLHRQVGRLLTLEDAVDVAGCEAILVNKIRPIRNQPAVGDEQALEVYSWEFVSGSKSNDQIAMKERQWAPRYEQAASGGALESRDGMFDLAGIAHVDRDHLQPE